MGSYVLQANPSGYSSLPPDFPFIGNPYNSSYSPSRSDRGGTVSPVVIAIIGCLGAAFLIVSYYTMVAKYCRTRRVFARGRRDEDFDEADEQDVVVWPIFARGLHESIVQAIPVCKYSKSEGLVDGSECAVCLSEFEEEESLRLLPKCNHAFHLPCIDKWLQSHSNCPLCRANILSSTPLLVPSTPAPEPSGTTAAEDNAAQVAHSLQEAGISLDAQNRSDRRTGDQSSPGEGTEAEMEERRWFRAPSRRNKIFSKLIDGLQLPSDERMRGGGLRCASAGRALMGLEEGRLQDECQEYDRGAIPIRRSSSVGTCSKFGVRLDRFRGNQSSSMDSCQADAAEAPRFLRSSSSSVKLNIGLNNATGSTSSSGSSKIFKSRSLSHGADLRNKAELNDPVMARMLLSLRGPITVKRSFSGGRLFGFRVKNIAGTASARPPV